MTPSAEENVLEEGSAQRQASLPLQTGRNPLGCPEPPGSGLWSLGGWEVPLSKTGRQVSKLQRQEVGD